MSQGPLLEIEARMYDAVKRSATVIVSGQIKRSLGACFSTPEFILVLVAAQCALTYLRSLPGFGASWDALRSIAQNVAIQTFVGYITEAWSYDLGLLNLASALMAIECFPEASGWVGQDLASFRTSVTYIFAEKVSEIVKGLGVPLLGGAALSACVPPRRWGLFGETLALSGVNVLCEVAFSVVDGGFSLSLAWPIVLLYFVRELSDRHEYFQPYFDFGVFKISEIAYASLVSVEGVSASTVGLGFGFAFFAAPRDKLWGGLCALVLVYAWSDWLLKEALAEIVKADPALAGLALITAIYFIGFVVNCK